ncbi:MAG: dTMP kinase [Firmicutes bacterium]|nr:dTMP kinase [Bacillota bacterium]
MRRVFITLEGPDGSGKSTQAALLAERLRECGLSVLLTREPGGTELGEALRKILLNPDKELAVMTEVLLMAADRAQHVEEVIKPALQNNMIVICDRYIDSSLAYQGFGLLGDISKVLAINEVAIGGLWPNLTLLLDVEPKVGLARHAMASNVSGSAPGLDRIERRELSFHQRVRKGYHSLQRIYGERFYTIDTTDLKTDIVAQQAWEVVVRRFCIPECTSKTYLKEGEGHEIDHCHSAGSGC